MPWASPTIATSSPSRPQQRVAEERTIQDAMKASQATARDLSQTMQQELSTLRFDFDKRLNTALAAYRAANPGAGVLILGNNEPGRDSFVVRNTAYDLSGQLAAMVKAGPLGASACCAYPPRHRPLCQFPARAGADRMESQDRRRRRNARGAASPPRMSAARWKPTSARASPPY